MKLCLPQTMVGYVQHGLVLDYKIHYVHHVLVAHLDYGYHVHLVNHVHHYKQYQHYPPRKFRV